MLFMTHHDGPREHYLGSYHCAHADCPGTFESHQRYLLEESRFDCSECLAKDGIQVDPDIVAIQYYHPIAHFEIEHIEGKGWVKVDEQGNVKGTGNVSTAGQNEEEEDEDLGGYAYSFASLSDCDSVTSHWRLDQIMTLPVRPTTADTKKKSPSPLYQEPTPTEEAYETRSSHEPHEMHDVREPVYEDAAEDQEPHQEVCPESPSGDSPSTLEHRNLVNQQLATLEHRMARRQHQRQNSQPMFDVTRPHHMTRHQRRSSKRRFDATRQQRYTFPAFVPSVPPGPVKGGPEYEDGHYYLVPATPISGITADWRWGPVPPPHLTIPLPHVSRTATWTNDTC